MKLPVIAFLTFLLSTAAYSASNFSLDNINKAEVDLLTEEWAANWVYSNASSPKVTGDLIPVIGIEFGVVAGITDAPNWNRLIKEQDPTTDIDKLPYLNAFVSVGIKPINLSLDLAMIPEQTADNAKFKNTSLAAKWTFINGLGALPLNVAVKGHFTSNELSYTDTINNASTGNVNVTGKTSLETTSFGAQILAGFDFAIIEPYIGLGFVKSDVEMKLQASGATTIFDQSVSLNAEGAVESNHTSAQFIAGLVLDLLIPNIGVEFMSVHGTSRITAKVGLSF